MDCYKHFLRVVYHRQSVKVRADCKHCNSSSRLLADIIRFDPLFITVRLTHFKILREISEEKDKNWQYLQTVGMGYYKQFLRVVYGRQSVTVQADH